MTRKTRIALRRSGNLAVFVETRRSDHGSDHFGADLRTCCVTKRLSPCTCIACNNTVRLYTYTSQPLGLLHARAPPEALYVTVLSLPLCQLSGFQRGVTVHTSHDVSLRPPSSRLASQDVSWTFRQPRDM